MHQLPDSLQFLTSAIEAVQRYLDVCHGAEDARRQEAREALLAERAAAIEEANAAAGGGISNNQAIKK